MSAEEDIKELERHLADAHQEIARLDTEYGTEIGHNNHLWDRTIELEAQVSDLKEARKIQDANIDHMRSQRSAAHQRIDELTAEVERLREGWMVTYCAHLTIHRYATEGVRCDHDCPYSCKDGDYCEAVRKAVGA